MDTLVNKQGQRLDWFWAALSTALAIDALLGNDMLDAEAILYFCVHLLTAILFLIRNPPLNPTLTPARYTVEVRLDKETAYGSLAWRACM